MRIIHNSSIVVMLSDILTKQPVQNALFLIDDEQKPYIHKESGHYVFYDLPFNTKKMNIICEGYVSVELDINLIDNKPQEFNIVLSYDSQNRFLENVYRFSFVFKRTFEKKSNLIGVLLKHSLPFLELEEIAKKGDFYLKLNMKESSIFPQKYIYLYGKDQHKIFITGGDFQKGHFLLQRPLESDLYKGGLFYLYWDFFVDDNNIITIPFLESIMRDFKKICFWFFVDEKKYQTTTITKRFNNKKKLLVRIKKEIHTELEQIPPPPPPPSEEKKDSNEDKNNDDEKDKETGDSKEEKTDDTEDTEVKKENDDEKDKETDDSKEEKTDDTEDTEVEKENDDEKDKETDDSKEEKTDDTEDTEVKKENDDEKDKETDETEKDDSGEK